MGWGQHCRGGGIVRIGLRGRGQSPVPPFLVPLLCSGQFSLINRIPFALVKLGDLGRPTFQFFCPKLAFLFTSYVY